MEMAFTGKSYASVREVAVLWSRDGAYLWRARAGRAEKVFVKLVRRDSGRILVDGKLNAGDAVVVQGVQGLRIGQRLDPRPFVDPARVDAPPPDRPAVKGGKAATANAAAGTGN